MFALLLLPIFFQLALCESANSNFTIILRSPTVAEISWTPFAREVIFYEIHIVSLPEESLFLWTTENGNSTSYKIRKLFGGGTYSVNVTPIYSQSSRGAPLIFQPFTTIPETPLNIITCIRDESKIEIHWLPPYEGTIFDRYEVKVHPPDAEKSTLSVAKESESSNIGGRAQFIGLIPGRLYNISIYSVSRVKLSNPLVGKCRTTPLPPSSITYDKNTLTNTGVNISWEPPKEPSEFDRYRVFRIYSLGSMSNNVKVTLSLRSSEISRVYEFNDDDSLEPGRTYQVMVTCLSAENESKATKMSFTIRPSPVKDLTLVSRKLTWSTEEDSFQSGYKIVYGEIDSTSASVNVSDKEYEFDLLTPGKNYSFSVRAISNNIESEATVLYYLVPNK